MQSGEKLDSSSKEQKSRRIDCEGSCVPYSPMFTGVRGLTQGPKESIIALAALGGDGAAGGGTCYLSK